MVKLWTPERNERLLSIAAFDNTSNDAQALLNTYVRVYGKVDDFRPAPSAIKDQLATLRKRYLSISGGKAKASATGGRNRAAVSSSTPKTPKASDVPKTPASASKRKKDDEMSEGDDTDSEPENDVSPAKKTKRLSTRSSGGQVARQNYAALADNDEEDADGEQDSVIGDAVDAGNFDYHLDFDGAAEKKPAWLSTNGFGSTVMANGKGPDTFGGLARGRGTKARKDEFDDDSDGSEYNPFA